MLPDFAQLTQTFTDLDSRLEQIANQGRTQNGLLALLILAMDRDSGEPLITPSERTQMVLLVRTAFADTTRVIRTSDDGTVIE